MSAEGEKLEKLRRFYSAHPPAKTQKQLEKLLRQQSWEALCGRLREKYGTDPEQDAAAGANAAGEAPMQPQEPTSPVPWETETTGTSGIADWQLNNERNAPLPRSTSIAIAKEGILEKEKSEHDWKTRYCELVVDDDEGARLVYRQKQGKRELGRVMLTGAKVTHGSVAERATLLLVDAGGLEYKFGSTDHGIVSEWVNSLQAAMGVDDRDAATGLDSELQQTSAWALEGQEKPAGPASVSSVASTAVSVLAGETVHAGNLDKQKDRTWKQRYCELSIDDDEGARLVYRQKPGKRMMGIASLARAMLSQSTVGERATFTLVDSTGVEYTFGSADSSTVEQWVTKIREAMGAAPGASSPDREPELTSKTNPAAKSAPEPEPEPEPELELEAESEPEQRQQQAVSQEEVPDDDFLLLEQQAVEEAETKGGVFSPPPPISAARPEASKPPPLPAKTQKERGPTASDFMASLVGDDSPRTPLASGAQNSPSEGLPPVPASDQSSKLKMVSAGSQAHVAVSHTGVEAMKQELEELRLSNAQLRQAAHEAEESRQNAVEANAVLERRAAAAEKMVSSTESKQAAAVETATSHHVREADRLKEDVGKLRRELLSRNAQLEEIRGKMTALAAARDAALANEQAAVESNVAERAASEQAVVMARAAGDTMAAQLREQLQEAESRVVAADAANVQAAKREEALREESGEQSLVLEAMSKQVEQLQVERSNLEETLSKATSENARLVDQIGGSEKEHNKRIEELLHQVELWEAEANRLNDGATEKDAIVTQMRAEAEQLYNELGALHQSADETQATLSSRARKAEAEVVRLRIQVSQIEDSAEDSVAGHEEESARHMAELRSEISRLLIQESEAKDLAQTHSSRIAELEKELAANQSTAAAAAESAAVAVAEVQEKLSTMESRAQTAEELSLARLTELGTLEEKVVSLSSQLVSSHKEHTTSKAALEQRISAAQRDNGKFVLELSSLRGELAELRNSATAMATVHAEKDKQIAGLSQDVLSLTQQLNEQQQQLDGRDAEHADLTREQSEAFKVRVTQLEAKLDEAQQETASALQVQSEISENLESTKLELAAATARVATAESAAEVAKTQREVSIDAERKAKAELQERLDEIEEGTSEMEKLIEENEDLVAQNKAYRNRLRAMPTSAFGFENRAEAPSARFDPAVALLRHGANVKAAGRIVRGAAAPDEDSPLETPGFDDTMAKAGALLHLVENPSRVNRRNGDR